MLVRIGNTFLNLNNVVRVRFSSRSTDGEIVAVASTTASGPADPSGAAVGPDLIAFEDDEARQLRAILEILAANGDSGPVRAG